MVKENRIPADMASISRALLIVSIGLALGGLVIDMGYVVRKFKVIYALNQLLHLLVESNGDAERLRTNEARPTLGKALRVSGDSKGGSMEKGWGWSAGMGAVIYITPLLVTFAGLSLSGLQR